MPAEEDKGVTPLTLHCRVMAAGPWAGAIEFVREITRPVPHPFMVTPKHVSEASDRYGGCLGPEALAAHPCGECRRPYKAHTLETLVLIRLLKNMTNAELAALLFPAKADLTAFRVAGIVIDENGFKVERAPAGLPDRPTHP